MTQKMQYTYEECFGYLSLVRNMLISLADVGAIVAALCRDIICIQVVQTGVYNYLIALATHTVSPILITLPHLRQLLLGEKESVTVHPRISIPSDPEEDIWSY